VATSWIEYDCDNKMEKIRRKKKSDWFDKMTAIKMMLRVRKPMHCILIEGDEEQMNGSKNRMLTWESLPNPNGESDIIGNFKLLGQLFKGEKGIEKMILMISFHASLNL
jgi:hypothetical protein